MELAQRTAPQGVGAQGPTGLERPAGECDQASEVATARTQVHHRGRVASDDERERVRVADEVYDERLLGREPSPHFLPPRSLARHEARVLGGTLPDLEQEVGVRLLRAVERFASGLRGGAAARATDCVVARGHVLELARQLGDAAAQVLLAGNEVRGRVSRRGDTAPAKELEHLTRAQALARLERRAGPAAGALGERELRIHFPFVREKRRAPLRQRERAAGALHLGDGEAQLARRLLRVALRAAGEAQPGVEVPGNIGRGAAAQALQRGAIE